MHFAQLPSANVDPDLNSLSASITVVNEFKFLGLLFDQTFYFKKHMLNLLRVIAHKDMGANCATWLKLYRSHVRSKVDYGCVVYGSARKSVLESLDCVQNAALSTCLGTFRTSPVSSLHVEAGELPLELRSQQLSLQYMISKLRSNPSNPTFSHVFGTAFNRLFEARQHIYRHPNALQRSLLGTQLQCYCNNLHIKHTPWSQKPASSEFSLHLLGNKSEVTPKVFQSSLYELVSQYDGYIRIFTDGSQICEAVGTAAIVGSQISKKRLFLTHGHILRGETCLRSSVCDVDLTVEHILLHCVSFAIARDHFFNMTVTTLSELLSSVSSRSLIEFINKTGL